MAIIRHRYTDYGAEYTKVANYEITFKNVFRMKPLYELLHQWVVDEGYGASSDNKFKETFYLHKDTPGGKEIWVRWRLGKNPFSGPTKQDFWRFDLDIDIHVLTLKNVEVMVNNKKVKAEKGELILSVNANLIKDWEKKWGKHSILKHFLGFAKRNLFKKTEDRLIKELYSDAYRLRDIIDNFLGIETFVGTERQGIDFWRKKLPD